jgi:radical SAM superfamily enzyme YgiQ (UPF0313 family)
MHITFVATRKNSNPQERELYEMDFLLRVLGLKRSFVDLGLQTIAACTPEGVEIAMVDDYSESIDYDAPTDLVALSAKTSCVTRAYEVARRFREKGKKVVLGGIHASLRPDEALEHVDCVVLGEAEEIWPIVVADAQAGQLRPRYDAAEYPSMDRIPAPRWPTERGGRYLFHQLQTTRGCPFTCRFCSVPDISGQAFRFKPVENVISELRALPKKAASPLLAKRPLYVVDDNFISRTRYTKELLTAMVPLAEAGEIPPWSAEATLNVAQDEELLDLFRAAGCATLIIGIESVSQATLEDMAKGINFCMTYPDAIARIHERQMSVVGNFIVGFDTDTRDVFRNTLDFVQETGILYPFFSILTPLPGTALFDEFEAAGRLDHTDWARYDTRHVVFEPRHMRRDELMDGYIWLYEQAYGSDLMLDRLERHWKNMHGQERPRRGMAWAERAFVRTRLLPEMARGDRELRSLYRRAFKLLGSLRGDAGILLTMLDSYDFARFMRQARSPRWVENVQTFSGETLPPGTDNAHLVQPQWKHPKAVRRSARLKKPRVVH